MTIHAIGNVPKSVRQKPTVLTTSAPIARLTPSQLKAMQRATKQMGDARHVISTVLMDAGLDPSKVYRITPDGAVTNV